MSIPVAQLRAELAGAARRLRQHDFSRVLGGPCLDILTGNIRENFANQASPFGQPWPARKVEGDGHPLLIQSGALFEAAVGEHRGSVTRVSKDTLEHGVDTSVDEGGIAGAGQHQFGGKFIPPRPYLGMSEESQEKCAELVAADGAEAFK